MESLIEFYRPLSGEIGTITGASDSLAHVHGGMFILFVARIPTRQSLATWTPFLIVLVAALAKEVAYRIAHGVWRPDTAFDIIKTIFRSEEHTPELLSLMRISYASFCLEKNTSAHSSTPLL